MARLGHTITHTWKGVGNNKRHRWQDNIMTILFYTIALPYLPYLTMPQYLQYMVTATFIHFHQTALYTASCQQVTEMQTRTVNS